LVARALLHRASIQQTYRTSDGAATALAGGNEIKSTADAVKGAHALLPCSVAGWTLRFIVSMKTCGGLKTCVLPAHSHLATP
jgi:hypothetical protein